MDRPVKLSDELVVDARLAAELSERSIAGQIEFWAQLGRSLEPILRGDRALALRRAGAAHPLSEAIAGADSDAGRQRVKDYLQSQPFPHYVPVAGRPGVLRRIEEDGTETIGRFVNRAFEPLQL